MKKRMKPEVRKESILAAALKLAEEKGYTNITREQVAAVAGISGTAVQYHFHTMSNFRQQLMQYAVACNCLAVVAQGLVMNDKQAKKASVELKFHVK